MSAATRRLALALHIPNGQKTETGDKRVGYPRPVWRRRRRSGTIFGRSTRPGRRPGPPKGPFMDWARILAYVTGAVDQELLARNEYLATENRILKAQLKGRLKLSDAERVTLGEIGHRLGRKLLAEVATVAKPDTILAWYHKLVVRKFDGSKGRRGLGRPRIKRELEQLIVRMASENRDWGYDRIVGALANLGYEICAQTVGNVLRRHALPPAPESARPHGRPLFGPTSRCWSERLLHGGGADSTRAGILLRAVFHPSGQPPGGYRWHHHSSGRAVDEANRPERDNGGMRRPAGLPLSPARSGH